MKILLIDGNYLTHRTLYKLFNFKTTTGIYTGGIFGFFNSLSSLISEGYRKIVVVFDGGHSKRRKEFFPEYKKKDYPKPEPGEANIGEILYYSMRMNRLILDNLGIRCIKLPGVEGDDLIYVLAKHYGFDNCIVSSDDYGFLQLVEYGVEIYRHMKGEFINGENFNERMGFPSEFFLLYKAIVGHNSDNVSGIPQVGDTTAAKIIKEMTVPTVEELEKVAKSSSNFRFKKVVENLNIVERNLELVDLRKEKIDEDILKREMSKELNLNLDAVISLFRKFEIKSLSKLLIQADTLIRVNI